MLFSKKLIIDFSDNANTQILILGPQKLFIFSILTTNFGPKCFSESWNFEYLPLKGAGGVFNLANVEIEFSIVSDRGECQLPDVSNRVKKYWS